MDTNEIFRYLKLIYRRRYLFIITSFLIMVAVVAVSYQLPKKYKADSTVFIERSVINDLIKGIAITPDMDERIRVLKYALLSRDVVGKVLAELDIDTTLGKAKLQDTITRLQERTDLKIKGKDLFIVSITDKDPDFAKDYINTLVSIYVEDNLSAKREETYGANRFLDEQITLFKAKLDLAEDAIIEFRRKQGIFLAVDEKSLLTEINEFQKEIQNLQLSIDTLNAKKKSFRQQLSSVDPTVTLFSERQTGDRAALLQKEIAKLLLSYTENYPEVLRLKAELESLKRRQAAGEEPGETEFETTSLNPLHQELNQKLLEVETEISSLAARRALLENLKEKKEKELQSVPENKKELAVLTQERDSHRKIYEELLMRKGQSEVSKQMEIGDKATTFRIVDPAVFPEKPVSPNMIKMILLAIAAGLGGGFGLIYLLDQIDGSIKDTHQLQALGVDVIAVIPSIIEPAEKATRRKKDLLAYGFALFYLTGMAGLLAFEFLKK